MAYKPGIDHNIILGHSENTVTGLGIPEKQSEQGYVPSFLTEHRVSQSIMSNPMINLNDRMLTVSASVRFNVSLITYEDLRNKLWLLFESEIEKRIKERPNCSQDEKVRIEYAVACMIEGKVMDHIKGFMEKPLDVGTE